MLLEVALNKLQSLISLGAFFLLFEPCFFDLINFYRIFPAVLITFQNCLFLVGKFLIERAHFLQNRRGRFQLLLDANGVHFNRFQRPGLFPDGGLQSGKRLFLGFQCCSVIHLLFAGGGERCVYTIQ